MQVAEDLGSIEAPEGGKPMAPRPPDDPVRPLRDDPLVHAAMLALVADAPIGFAVLDRDLRYVAINDRLATINGFPAVDHIGRTVREMVPEIADAAEHVFSGVLATGEPCREWEISGVFASAPDAERHWVESVFPLWLHGSPVPSGLAVVVWEVTGRVSAERAQARTLALLDLLIGHAPIGIAFLDADLRYVRINQTLAAVNGLPVAAHLGRTPRELLPDLARAVEPILRRVLATGEPVIGLELETAPTHLEPDRRRHWKVSYYPIPATSGSGWEGLGMIVTDETDRVEGARERARLRAAERQASQRAIEAAARQQILLHATERLASAVTYAEVTDAIDDVARGLLQATTVRVQVTSPGGVGAAGAREACVADGTPFRQLAGGLSTQEVHLPLLHRGHPVGEVGLAWVPSRVVDDDERALLLAIASQFATALDRARMYEAERVARAEAEVAQSRLDLLACVSDALGRTLDERQVLDALGSVLVPDHVDWLVVVLPDGRGRLSPDLCVHAEPSRRAAVDAILRANPVPIDSDTEVARVFRTQTPVCAVDIRPYLDKDVPAAVAGFLKSFEVGAGLLLPMVVGGRAIGVLAMCDATQRGDRLTRELPLFTAVASRAAAALANARLYGQTTLIATRLQQALMPAQLPDIPGASLAVRYTTAQEAAAVGGDFYDVVHLEAGRYLLVIGDVAGRGIDAAGLSGLARQSLRALATDLSPAQALQRLNEIIHAHGQPERFLTAACAELTVDGAGSARLALVRAGHPHPVIVRADGGYTFPSAAGAALGVLRSVPLAEELIDLRSGDAVILYTDGITEARGSDGLFGEARLAHAAAVAARVARSSTQQGPASNGTSLPTADTIADAVITAVDGYRTVPAEDDSALLVLRLT